MSVRSRSLFSLTAWISFSIASCSPPHRVATSNETDQVQAVLRQLGTPAVAATIMDSGSTSASGVAGVRIWNKASAVTISDLWHLGSNTKAMTAALAAILVERGQLSFNTTLADVLPNQPGVLPVYETATLEQFLSHRAGVIPLTQFSALPGFSGDIHQQRLAFVSWALSQPPAAPPGTQTLYSNAGYVVAAAMLETVLNETWEQALTAEVLTPLAIQGKFGWPAAGDSNQPWGHTWHNSRWVPNDPNSADNLFPPVLNPAGNLSMSLGDDAKWALLNLRGLQGVNSPILSAASIQKLHSAVGVPPGQAGYALGWGVAVINGHLVSYHLGSAGTFDAEIAIDATGNRAIVIMANGDNSGGNYTPNSTLETMDNLTIQLLTR